MTPTLSPEALERLTRDIDEAEKDNLCYAQVWVKDARALIAEVERFKPRPISEAPKGVGLMLWFQSATEDGANHVAGVFSFDDEGRLWDDDQQEIIGDASETDIGSPLYYVEASAFALPSDGGGS